MINTNKPCFDQDDAVMLNDALYNSYDFNFCEAFENTLKEYFNIPYAVVTSSGTTALQTALKAIGVKKNDRVLTNHQAIKDIFIYRLFFTKSNRFIDVVRNQEGVT